MKYSKFQLIGNTLFTGYCELLWILLNDDCLYTIGEVDSIINNYLRKGA